MSHRVLAIKTMKKFPKEKEASEILQRCCDNIIRNLFCWLLLSEWTGTYIYAFIRVVNVVTPTLERRGWQIKNLTEFYPG